MSGKIPDIFSISLFLQNKYYFILLLNMIKYNIDNCVKGARDMINDTLDNEKDNLLENEESLTTQDEIELKDGAMVSGEKDATNNDKAHKALYITNIVVNCVFYFFIFMLLLFSISQIAGSKDGKVKNVFGLGYETVLTDSMSPTFESGDLVWVTTNFKTSKLKVGDIVTFWDTISTNPTSNENGFLNTHRIVDITYGSNGKPSSFTLQGDIWKTLESGQYYYPDCTEAEQTIMRYNNTWTQTVEASAIKAKYIGHWDGTGRFINWLSNPKKGFIVVILFTGAFLIFEMFMVIKNIMEIRTAKMVAANTAEKEEMKKSLEEERERMKQELLEQLRAEAAAKNPEEDKAVDNKENEEDEEESNKDKEEE